MTKIYIFSGLGADHRAFENINFKNLAIQHISWIQPLESESIQSYALRISEKITNHDAILIGLSFGGMLLMEIAKIKKSKKIILISSAKTKNELPLIYHYFGKFKFNKLIPNSIFKKSNSLLFWLFGVQTIDEKKILNNIIIDTDIYFLKWAINEILNWQNTEIPNNVIHIHGTSDKIIPFKNIKANYIIKNGSHLMTLNKSKEIEDILHNIIR